MLRSFRDRYLPHFQAPDAPSSPATSSGGSEPSTSGATPSSAPSSSPSAEAPQPTSATPSGAGAPQTPTPSDGADSSFEFMFSPTGDDPFDALRDLGLSPPNKETPEPKAAQTPPAEPPKPAAQPAEPAAPNPAATPAPTEATSPTAPTVQPNLDPFDPGHLAQHLEQNQEQVVQYVADNLFKLSDKDVEALESDVVGTIPKLLARSFVAAQQNLLLQMSRIIPRMIERQGEVSKQHNEAVNEFYTRWADIGKVKDQKVQIGDKQVAVSDLVKQYAVVYRQMHPQATRQDAIEAVGPMVMMAAKIVPGAAAPQAPAARPSPMAPTGASGRPPQPSPFMPAGPAAGGATSATVPQMSAVEAIFAGDPNEG